MLIMRKADHLKVKDLMPCYTAKPLPSGQSECLS